MMTEPTYLGNPNLKKANVNKSGQKNNSLSIKDVWMTHFILYRLM